MKIGFLACVFIFIVLNGWSQAPSHPAGKVPDPPFAGETIVLHLNSTFFVAGETLFFQVYCFEGSTLSKLSGVSSLAYVELIGVDQKPVAQMKVTMKNGMGSGDYFFPGNMASGNYTLIAYTKWMRNFPSDRFYSTNITLVNPQMRLPLADDTARTGSKDSSIHQKKGNNTGIQSLSIKTDRKEYGLRQQVSLQIDNRDSTESFLSVNVRSMEEELQGNDVWSHQQGLHSNPPRRITYLPDIRGELISGRVYDKVTGNALAGTVVTLSSPSKHFEFKVSATDSGGNFYFNVDAIASGYFLLKAPALGDQTIVMKTAEEFLGQYDGFVPPALKIEKWMQRIIDKRYLSAQVENVFYAAKKDSIPLRQGHRFYITPEKVYNLDDFTRFPTIEDVFREIVPEIVVKVRDGNYSLLLVNHTTGYRFTEPPLVLIDGVPVSDANIVMTYDPSFIKTISLIRSRYYYGPLEAEGVVSIETFDGDARGLPVDDMFRVSYVPPQPEKIYYFPQYTAGHKLARIPDYRSQLYWNPQLTIKKFSLSTLTFFTGDLPGKYYVEVVGVTAGGTRIYRSEHFEVK